MSTRLIQCGDHSWAPWCVVCVHLVEGLSDQWEPVPTSEQGSEVEFDWLCPECLKREQHLVVEDLKAICIHCVRALQAKAQRPAV